MNASIVFRNLADSAQVSASSSLLLARPERVQQAHVSRRWRSLTQSASIVAAFSEPTELDTLAFVGLTATQARCRISSDDQTGSAGDLYDSGWQDVDLRHMQSICVLPDRVAAGYVRVDLTSSALAYVEMGRFVAGIRSEFGFNFAPGWGLSYVDPSIRARTVGGQVYVQPRDCYRTFDLTFEAVSKSDRDSFVDEIDRVNSLKRDVLLIVDAESENLSRNTIWGLMSEVTPVIQPHIDRWSKSYRIEERL